MKKLLTILLALCLVGGLTPSLAFADPGGGEGSVATPTTIDGDDLEYNYDSATHTATVTGLKQSVKDDTSIVSIALTIPATVSKDEVEYKVTAIGDYAFNAYQYKSKCNQANGKITSVTFEENSNIQTIGQFAFADCQKIEKISIPASVTTIGENCFFQCNCTFEFANDSKLETIGKSAFQCCTFETIVLPATVTAVKDGAFYKCENLKIATFKGAIPNPNADNINVLDSWFSECIALTEINAVGESSEGYYTEDGVIFKRTDDEIILVKYPEAKEGAYTVPSGVTSIGENAFSNCTKLTIVTLPDGLISIGDAAFKNCTGLKSIILPNSLTSIKNDAFQASGLTSITVPGSVKTISTSMFKDCTALTNVVLSEGIEEIGSEAFSGCTSLSTITIPTKLNSISGEWNKEGNSFQNCTNITTVVYNGSDNALVAQIVGQDKVSGVLKRQKDAPTNLTATAPDNSNQDNGKISGVSNTMEYQREGADGWTTCTGTEITGLTAGTYKVREKEEYDYVAGLEATVVVPKKVVSCGGGSSRQYPTVAETTNGTVTLSSNGRSATITPDAGYEIASVTVNGEDKGAVSTLTGLRTGDKIEAIFQKTKETLDVEAKAAVASLSTMKARSSKTTKGNIKVVAKLSTAEKGKLTELTDLGYTVKYKFYRSTKKASGYKARIEKDTSTYINTSGKSGTRYYYKAQIRVYDSDGTLVAKTKLKSCKYACRKF